MHQQQTPLKTNECPVKRDNNRISIFQPLIFRGDVSFPGENGAISPCKIMMTTKEILRKKLMCQDTLLKRDPHHTHMDVSENRWFSPQIIHFSTFLERYLSRRHLKSMPVDLEYIKPFMGFCTTLIYVYIYIYSSYTHHNLSSWKVFHTKRHPNHNALILAQFQETYFRKLVYFK